MNLNALRKEITELIDDVKYYSDSLTPEHTIPVLKINIIMAKMQLMLEKTIVLKHYLEIENEKFEADRKEARAIEKTELKRPVENTDESNKDDSGEIQRDSKEDDQQVNTAAEVKETKEESPASAPASGKNLKNSIGIYERYLFANELFNGSIESFDEAIKALNEIEDVEKAMYYVREGLIKEFGWKEDNKQVKAFLQLVERKYS